MLLHMKYIKKVYAVYKTLEAYEFKLRIFFRSQKFEFIFDFTFPQTL